PIKKIHVLHQPDGVCGEAEAHAANVGRTAPHVVSRIAESLRQRRRKLAHHEYKSFGHVSNRSGQVCASPSSNALWLETEKCVSFHFTHKPHVKRIPGYWTQHIKDTAVMNL